MYFRNYVVRKTWLGKYRKIQVQDDRSKSNMVNGPKHCSNHNDSVFTTFIDQSEGN